MGCARIHTVGWYSSLTSPKQGSGSAPPQTDLLPTFFCDLPPNGANRAAAEESEDASEALGTLKEPHAPLSSAASTAGCSQPGIHIPTTVP